MIRRVSILVPFPAFDPWVIDCVAACADLDTTGVDVQLCLLPDDAPDPARQQTIDALELPFPVQIVPTGPINPAAKRNRGMAACRADFYALVDADARPRADWLQQALPLFTENIGAVAGPNLTPEDDPVSRRAPGRVMASPLGFGAAYLRHTRKPRRDVREMPTCNLFILPIEGLTFREDLDTGEDMTYCAELRARGFRILYDPGVVVVHHRRQWGRSFLNQFYHYGFDKGRMARAGSDGTYPWQAFPSLLLLYLLALPVMLVFLRAPWVWISLLPLAAYTAAVTVETLRLSRGPIEWLPVASGFLLGHLGYGWGGLRGWCSRSHSP